MDDIINKLKEFNVARDWDQFHTPENISKSIAIEAGELLECFQWNNEFDIDRVKDELADILLYSIILSYKLDVNVLDIISEKISRNELRYPVSKSKGNSKKYTEFTHEDSSKDI